MNKFLFKLSLFLSGFFTLNLTIGLMSLVAAAVVPGLLPFVPLIYFGAMFASLDARKPVLDLFQRDLAAYERGERSHLATLGSAIVVGLTLGTLLTTTLPYQVIIERDFSAVKAAYQSVTNFLSSGAKRVAGLFSPAAPSNGHSLNDGAGSDAAPVSPALSAVAVPQVSNGDGLKNQSAVPATNGPCRNSRLLASTAPLDDAARSAAPMSPPSP